MAAPTHIETVLITGATGALTCTLPTSPVTNDILILFIETANEAITIPTPNGGTWTEITGSPQGTGTGGTTTATRLTAFWSRYNGTQTAPVTSDSGDHQVAVMVQVRGCETSGDPWNITSSGVEATSDTSVSITGATTSVNDCLVVGCLTLMDDAQDLAAGWTHPFTDFNQRANHTTTAGNDARMIAWTGEFLTAGTYSATTTTLNANSVKAFMTIALKPPAGGTPAEDPYPYIGGGYYG